MNEHLTALLQRKDLTFDASRELFAHLIRGELSETEIAAALVALKVKGERSEEIAGAAAALVDAARPFPRPEIPFADVVGTGGDGVGTINISTAVALVCAASGLPVAKHGNRAVSSQCGAADLLERFGMRLEVEPAVVRHCIDQTGFGFLFAPHYHQGIRYAMPIRKQLGTRTMFNILGPLVNPSRPPIMLVGVYDPSLCRPVAESLRRLNCSRALVVHGQGLDEIALHGPTVAMELRDGEINQRTFTPSDFGVAEYPLSHLIGGPPAENALAIQAILAGGGAPAHTIAVAVNAGALLWLADLADSPRSGCERAQKVIAEGRPIRHLEHCASISRGEY